VADLGDKAYQEHTRPDDGEEEGNGGCNVTWDPVSERYKIQISFAGGASLEAPLPDRKDLAESGAGADFCESHAGQDVSAPGGPEHSPASTEEDPRQRGLAELVASAAEDAGFAEAIPRQRGFVAIPTSVAEDASATSSPDSRPRPRSPASDDALPERPRSAVAPAFPAEEVPSSPCPSTPARGAYEPQDGRHGGMTRSGTPFVEDPAEGLLGAVVEGVVGLSSLSQPQTSPAEARELLLATIGAVERLADWRWPATAGLGLGLQKEARAAGSDASSADKPTRGKRGPCDQGHERHVVKGPRRH